MTTPVPETPTAPTTPAPETPAQTTTPAPTVQFNADQEHEIRRRIAAARKDGEQEGKRAADEAVAEAKRKADDAAENDRKIKAGEFESVRAGLEKQLTDAETARDDYKARYERAIAQIGPGVAAQWTDVPAEVAAMFDGADDDVLAKAAFLAKSRDLIGALSAKTGPGPGAAWPNTPKPNGAGTPAQAQDAEKARLLATGKYAI